MGFVLIVCGGRDYNDRAKAFHTLDRIHAKRPIVRIVEGGASGADSIAREWANSHGVECRTFHADWTAHGKAAGPMRNQLMLDSEVDGVLAFPGGRGTADMVSRARSWGVTVMEVTP